jgi:hypothetical protein
VISTSTPIDYGLDAGMKFAVRAYLDPVRADASGRDSYDKAAFGATFGIGFHWR